jgi:lysophospholipase L1-like esterase
MRVVGVFLVVALSAGVCELITSAFFFYRYKDFNQILANENNSFGLGVLATRISKKLQGYDVEKISYDVSGFPISLLSELKELGGGLENAGNPTNINLSNSPIVLANNETEFPRFFLIPNASVTVNMVSPKDRFNFDPPTVFFPTSAIPELSIELREWLSRNTFSRYQYTIDSNGRRVTTFDSAPIKDDAKRVFVFGDSVAFGFGVRDESSLPFQLQRLLGDDYLVFNEAVGRYGSADILARIEAIEFKPGDVLIYVACENDFYNERSVYQQSMLQKTMENLLGLIDEKQVGEAIIFAHSNMSVLYSEYFQRWTTEQVIASKAGLINFVGLRKDFPQGVTGVLWKEIASKYVEESASLFSGAGLYVDDAHFSNLGNRLAAEALAELVKPIAVEIE